VFIWRLTIWSPAIMEVIAAPIELTRGVATTVELHNLRKVVLMNRDESGMYPPEATFHLVVSEGLQSGVKNPGLDSWGRPYMYRRQTGGFELRSAGPDRQYGTDDDLILTWKD
jgi:hypothetical protein